MELGWICGSLSDDKEDDGDGGECQQNDGNRCFSGLKMEDYRLLFGLSLLGGRRGENGLKMKRDSGATK